jgi:hypothetical protein
VDDAEAVGCGASKPFPDHGFTRNKDLRHRSALGRLFVAAEVGWHNTAISRGLQSCLQIEKLMYADAPCGISADEKTMQHLAINPTIEAGLPVIRHGRHPACALDAFSTNMRPKGLGTAK